MLYGKAVHILATAVLAAFFTHSASAQEKVLNVLSYGGPWNEVQEKTVIERFKQETGYTVTLGSQPVNSVAPIMAAKDSPVYDLVWMPAEDHAALRGRHAAAARLQEHSARQGFYDGSALPDGVITSFAAVAIVYNKDKIKTPPTSWNDLWNPAYKGHVVLGFAA